MMCDSGICSVWHVWCRTLQDKHLEDTTWRAYFKPLSILLDSSWSTLISFWQEKTMGIPILIVLQSYARKFHVQSISHPQAFRRFHDSRRFGGLPIFRVHGTARRAWSSDQQVRDFLPNSKTEPSKRVRSVVNLFEKPRNLQNQNLQKEKKHWVKFDWIEWNHWFTRMGRKKLRSLEKFLRSWFFGGVLKLMILMGESSDSVFCLFGKADVSDSNRVDDFTQDHPTRKSKNQNSKKETSFVSRYLSRNLLWF